MLSQQCVIDDLDLDQWKRLTDLALADRKARRLFVLHEGGQVKRCFDTVAGEQPVPAGPVQDAQALAERLLAEGQAKGLAQVLVLDPGSFHLALAAVNASLDPQALVTEQLGKEWDARFNAQHCGIAPKSDFILYGLPWRRLERFAQKMLPASCTFVLGAFDGDALWATLFAQFQDGRIVGLSTSAALDPDDVKDVVGRDQHPFLLASVANRYRRPAFGWFCQREDLEAYLLAPTVEDKEALFQTAIMKNRATFDFNILLDRGITPLSPVNPGEAAIAGAERNDNPRTAVPDPNAPIPDPSQEG